MIYIKTQSGWFYTGFNSFGPMPIHWSAYAQAFWDSELNDFTFPPSGHLRSRGMQPLTVKTKLQMWTMGEDFPLFNENKHLPNKGSEKVWWHS